MGLANWIIWSIGLFTLSGILAVTLVLTCVQVDRAWDRYKAKSEHYKDD